MKYLIFVFLFIFGSSILIGQDTLYVRGERKPLIVEINVIKKKKLSYSLVGSNRLKNISLKKVRKIKFDDNTKLEEQKEEQVELVVGKEEFRSTILAQTGGLLSQSQLGLNYMYRLSPAITEKISYWAQIGGGYHAQRTFRRQTKGYYLEFSGIVELASLQNPKNRFHFGIDINNQWAKGVESLGGSFLFPGDIENVEDTRLIIQIPVGYTFRNDNGFYMSMGLEIATALKFFPAINFRIGYCFGQ